MSPKKKSPFLDWLDFEGPAETDGPRSLLASPRRARASCTRAAAVSRSTFPAIVRSTSSSSTGSSSCRHQTASSSAVGPGAAETSSSASVQEWGSGIGSGRGRDFTRPAQPAPDSAASRASAASIGLL